MNEDFNLDSIILYIFRAGNYYLLFLFPFSEASLMETCPLCHKVIGVKDIEISLNVVRLLAVILIAFLTGKLISVLGASAPECASIIQGTIAAATVINEIIAVFMAKKGFEWAGELNKAEGGQTA